MMVSRRDRALDREDAASKEWRRPPGLLTDSSYPEQIADDLARLHRPYLAEARRIVLERLTPNEAALARGIRAETERYRSRNPHLDDAELDAAFAAANERGLAQLAKIVAAASPAAEADREPASAAGRRRARFGAAAPIMAGTISFRKQAEGGRLTLAWDANRRVARWTVRISARADPREDYAEVENVEVQAGKPQLTLTLDERSYRVTVLGHSHSGRVIERAIVSGLTADNWRTKWTRRPTSS
jgi:hypothetical protein